MKLKNDQIRIRWFDLSWICGIKDKLHTNIIFTQNEILEESGLGYKVFFHPCFPLWFCFERVEPVSFPNLLSFDKSSLHNFTITSFTNLSTINLKHVQL